MLLLQQSDGLELLDDVGEGVGDDGDHDEEREDEDEHGGHDGLYILTIQVVLLPGSSVADCCHKTPSECGVRTSAANNPSVFTTTEIGMLAQLS